jgi:signal peptide peptidase SppA
VSAIIIDVDSPGGQASGIAELSRQIYEARGKKPIVAVANHFMASAAYWIASAADEIVVTPSGEVGSIGVFTVHEDIHEALAQEGVKVSIIKEGRYKAEGNPYEPLTAEARDAIQARVREVYDAFVDAVARNRGVDAAAVRNGFGEGRMVSAYQAVTLGMADQVGTLDETIARLVKGNIPSGAKPLAVSSEAESRQEPAPAESHRQAALERLAQVGNKDVQGESTMLRGLLKERAEKVARAQALVQEADQAGRDLTDEERAEFQQLLGEGESAGEVGALDAKIDQVETERAKLKAAAERNFVDGFRPEKPAQMAVTKSMKRVEFEALNAMDKAAFVKGGGKVED